MLISSEMISQNLVVYLKLMDIWCRARKPIIAQGKYEYIQEKQCRFEDSDAVSHLCRRLRHQQS